MHEFKNYPLIFIENMKFAAMKSVDNSNNKSPELSRRENAENDIRKVRFCDNLPDVSPRGMVAKKIRRAAESVKGIAKHARKRENLRESRRSRKSAGKSREESSKMLKSCKSVCAIAVP